MTEEPEQTPTPDRGETTAQDPIEKSWKTPASKARSDRAAGGRMPLFGR